MPDALNVPRYFSHHPEEVARRHRAYMEAIKPLQAEILRMFGMFPRPRLWYLAAGSDKLEDLSPPWEESLPPEVKQHVENVRGHIARTAAEFGFEVPV